jgi:hypothetical protein
VGHSSSLCSRNVRQQLDLHCSTFLTFLNDRVHVTAFGIPEQAESAGLYSTALHIRPRKPLLLIMSAMLENARPVQAPALPCGQESVQIVYMQLSLFFPPPRAVFAVPSHWYLLCSSAGNMDSATCPLTYKLSLADDVQLSRLPRGSRANC